MKLLNMRIFLNLRTTDHAIAKVGTNDLLLSWIENQVSSMDNQSISDYERITLEIEKVQRKLKSGIEVFFSELSSNECCDLCF